ncbi:DUF397 domain-containing protein [Streptomyces sp. NBC_01381]|uniref:DUF397 domain-containing protein n=1 Tax=Streptomyces sp. NBC_01381 TaxID=2903845 RepID=UPI00224EA507|nr:DUF397 domain-containing protein [Streptomyces sp. NBC_01381]MCX4673656.1 DUF397 domain-containing protein [Streptomyces sp. NBC_01381]
MNSTTGRPSSVDLTNAPWKKASASSSNGGCLEVALLGNGYVAIRDNEDLGNAPFIVTEHVWRCWLDGAKHGEFDLPSA